MSLSEPAPEATREASWYEEGLSFTCTRCGACCTGAPGFVWVNAEEVTRLAEYRGETVEDFSRTFVRQVGQRYSLKERVGGDCIFWDRRAGCTVYPARPVQCRTWPFWPENIETEEAWDGVARTCPGAGRGQFFSADEVRAMAAMVHTL